MTKRPSQSWLLKRPQPEATYLQSLRFYWQGERESALALVSDELGEGEPTSSEAYYRLWIESLAESSSDAGLRELILHLEKSIGLGLLAPVSGTALIALSRYELGEREAAAMLWRSISKHGNDPYARELTLILSEDEAVKDQAAHTLLRISGDFFHIRRASLHFHSEGESKAYRQSITAINETFAGNPLHAEILFHTHFAKKRYTQALRWSKQLRDNFPQQSEYQFFFAYASYLTKDTKSALSEFESLNRKTEGTDPDILHLLGLSVFKESQGKADEIKKARHYLNRSKERYVALGYPALQLEESLMSLSQPKFAESSKYWVVKLSSKQAFDLSQKSDESIKTLYKSMGEFVERGDYCFFVTESRLGDNEQTGVWRLNALYRANSSAEWHPTHRWKTSLELIIRMETAIPIEVEGNGFQSRNPAAAFGLLEIDPSALVHFEECINEYTLDDPHYSHIVETLRIARAG
ncbi:MAG: hypothetical protein H7249_12270 [Chitinophagaceae bacterium]|nr:hypothetical protein [Oligoflexus sp.]